MRIVYLHQYFKTPEDGEAMRSYYVASAMVKAGHEVVMITTHNKSDYEKKIIHGIEVHYLPIFYSNEFSFARRLKAFLKFQKRSVKLVKKLGKFDLCYATSTPLTVGSAALKLKKDIGLPYIFEARDLWPDAPIELGIIKSKIIIKSLKRLEIQIYDNAQKIVALSPGVEKIIKERTATNIVFVPNMSDTDFYEPVKKLNLTPVILYAGTLGAANDVDQLIEIGKHYPEAKFMIAGRGKELSELKRKVETLRLNNIIFLGKLSKGDLKRLYEKADFAFISFLPHPILELNSPNKFFDALANGVPPIITMKGWLKDLVEQQECGLFVNSKNLEQAVQDIKNHFEDKIGYRKMSERARALAEEDFAVEKLTQKILGIMA